MQEKGAIMVMINQVVPVNKEMPLEGLYLGENLRKTAMETGRGVVLTNFLTDKNGVIAKADKDGRFQVPKEIKNSSDWGRFQELMAQADITISSGSYFKRLETSQDVLYPFEPGHTFEKLGEWRLNAGYPQRSPDVAIVTLQLDFELPEKLLKSGRKVVIFTTEAVASSDKSNALKKEGVIIVKGGETSVEGGNLIHTLADQMGYHVIMMVSGPAILDLLLGANRLDFFYMTEAQVEIPFDDPAAVKRILGGKKISELKEFRLAHQFNQDDVVTETGARISQSFLRYDRKDLRA